MFRSACYASFTMKNDGILIGSARFTLINLDKPNNPDWINPFWYIRKFYRVLVFLLNGDELTLKLVLCGFLYVTNGRYKMGTL